MIETKLLLKKVHEGFVDKNFITSEIFLSIVVISGELFHAIQGGHVCVYPQQKMS